MLPVGFWTLVPCRLVLGNGVFVLGGGGAITARCTQPFGMVHFVLDLSGYIE